MRTRFLLSFSFRISLFYVVEKLYCLHVFSRLWSRVRSAHRMIRHERFCFLFPLVSFQIFYPTGKAAMGYRSSLLKGVSAATCPGLLWLSWLFGDFSQVVWFNECSSSVLSSFHFFSGPTLTRLCTIDGLLGRWYFGNRTLSVYWRLPDVKAEVPQAYICP